MINKYLYESYCFNFEVEAIQWTGKNRQEIKERFPEVDTARHNSKILEILGSTSKNAIRFYVGDYIVKTDTEKYLSCSEDRFNYLYEPIEKE